MKRLISYSALLTALLVLTQVPGRAAETPAASSQVPTRKEAALLSVTASVESIDYANREITLKGPLGNSVTLSVDPKVKRLKEIKAGDLVQADYYVSVAAELRKPTPEEEKHPLVVLDGGGKAAATEAPGAGALRAFKVVTTIEGLDRPQQTVTVKGPRGHFLTARVENPKRLMEMRLGDTIVITYTEALAISVEKVEKKNAK
jgi:hypothetical protein